MKKVWNDATLEALDITATAGGIYDTEELDSEKWFDEEHKQWWGSFGNNNLSKAKKED
ncbi:hypothetical protein [Butyrivibrio sp. FC2001]|uniref:hypothetical protein n=1 Tax=Butyrivibrio sp. FC2001 TaxID=1280671 RepID=UPI00041A50AF|nr:hypothetical protein [Butyrivibrio sp. FC2001]